MPTKLHKTSTVYYAGRSWGGPFLYNTISNWKKRRNGGADNRPSARYRHARFESDFPRDSTIRDTIRDKLNKIPQKLKSATRPPTRTFNAKTREAMSLVVYLIITNSSLKTQQP